MGAVSSSLSSGADWVRTQGSALSTRQQPAQQGQSRRRRRRLQQSRNGDRSRRGPHRTRSRTTGAYDVESHGHDRHQDDEDDFDSLDDDTDEELDGRHEEDEDDEDDDDDSLLDGGEGRSGENGYDHHPLYFGPAFHPVIEQSPAQLQLQRQIEQQLEQQQRQEYWQQQLRQQQQQQQQLQQHQHQQQHQQQQLSSHSTIGGQQLSLNDFILPSAISGLGGVSAGGGTFPTNGGLGVDMGAGTGVGGHHGGLSANAADRAQEQLYRNSNLYNLISGLNVNPLLTEVQRAGTLDLSVLEQELDDVEGGWVDIEDEDDEDRDRTKEDDDTDVDYGHEGIVREMQPTKRSPTALACNINLKKSTLRLAKNFTLSNDPSIPPPSHLRPNYRLDFCFDSLTPCDVKLFWVVKEMEEDGDLGFRLRRLHHLPQPTAYHFPAGMNQRFISPILPLYTMSLPELTMQGLPSTSMRMFQKRNQKQWQQLHRPTDHNNVAEDDPEGEDNHNIEGEAGDGDGRGTRAGGRGGRKLRFGKKNSKKSDKDGKKHHTTSGSYPSLDDDDTYKAIMEDQYYPLVILIEATKEYNATGPVRSLPTPETDAPGLYLVNNQAISTFACFNISSEGGFEIKVMKQKVWINSTNYLVQEIYGFTDSVAPPSKLPKAPERTANPKSTDKSQGKVSLATQQRQSQDRGSVAASGTSKASPPLSRSMSRLSRAESIASRVNELTMDRPKKRKDSRKNLDSKSPVLARSRPLSSGSVVAGLEVADPDGREELTDGQHRFSMVSASSMAAAGENSGRMSDESLRSRPLSGGGTMGALEARAGGEAEGTAETEKHGGPVETLVEAEAEPDADADAETEEEEQEPNLVLLDAPECVICLSDVKDTIVLPCRHFCICSECGDVLRRRAPQRCPICRQVFQALLHIASTPTQKPEFAMVPSPASTVASNTAVNGVRARF
ncbi:hypothetical protein BGZ72_002383 [Mortierella alpina]|nr:hypothetical protein BGZ72_002383 [Mortierella alpina]